MLEIAVQSLPGWQLKVDNIGNITASSTQGIWLYEIDFGESVEEGQETRTGDACLFVYITLEGRRYPSIKIDNLVSELGSMKNKLLRLSALDFGDENEEDSHLSKQDAKIWIDDMRISLTRRDSFPIKTEEGKRNFEEKLAQIRAILEQQ